MSGDRKRKITYRNLKQRVCLVINQSVIILIFDVRDNHLTHLAPVIRLITSFE